MNSGIQTVAYLLAAIFFIKSLAGLSAQESAKRGNWFGIFGMLIAVLATLQSANSEGFVYFAAAIIVAAGIGTWLALKVQMTQMPQLVAILHSFVGLAAVLVGFASYFHAAELMGVERTIHLFEIYLGVFIGAVTFTGSVVAYGKLQGILGGSPLLYPGRHLVNLFIVFACCYLGYEFIAAEDITGMNHLLICTALASVLGVLLVSAIGGADMPVVVSMLNSYSGWAAAAAGFMLSNDLLIVTGALVGSSGAILSYIMCSSMNRSIINVIFGGFGTESASPAASMADQGEILSAEANEVADLLKAAKSVVIVPGYGMAVAKAQYPIFAMIQNLQKRGIKARFAIHPVAGRLPGHMNILLAEAKVPYDIVLEMDEINDEMSETDLVLVVGANDIVNPGAEDDASSPIYGMPVIKVWEAKDVIVLKRSMATGFAGVQNPLFFKENTRLLFGDAKDSIDKLVSDL